MTTLVRRHETSQVFCLQIYACIWISFWLVLILTLFAAVEGHRNPSISVYAGIIYRSSEAFIIYSIVVSKLAGGGAEFACYNIYD